MIVFFVVVIFLFDEITLWPIRCAAKMVVAKICSKDVYGKDAYRKKCLKQIYIYIQLNIIQPLERRKSHKLERHYAK